jgi:hypothetical protein
MPHRKFVSGHVVCVACPPAAMRLSLRFVLPLLLVIIMVAYAVQPLVDQLTLRWFVRDLDIRAMLISNTLQDPLVDLARANSRTKISALFSRLAEDERIYAIGFCDTQRRQFVGTRNFPGDIGCDGLDKFADGSLAVLPSAKGPLHVAVERVGSEKEQLGKLVVVHDMSFITRRSEETKRYVFWFLVGLGALMSVITVVVAQLSWRGWVQGMKAIMRGEGLLRPTERIAMPELRPLARDLRTLVQEIESSYRPRDESQVNWSPDSLRAAGERRRDRARADHARLFRHLDRARQRLGRPRGGRPPRPRRRASRQAALPHPAGVAERRGGGRLLLRLRQRRAVAALPHRPRPADLPY